MIQVTYVKDLPRLYKKFNSKTLFWLKEMWF